MFHPPFATSDGWWWMTTDLKGYSGVDPQKANIGDKTLNDATSTQTKET